MKVKAEVEVKKDDNADAQDDDKSFRSSLLSSLLSPPVLPSDSSKMDEVPSSNRCCHNNNNPCSSRRRSSSNPSLSKCMKTEEYEDSSRKSSDDINVEEEAEDFYNNNSLFFAHTNVQQQQQQQQQQAITTTTDTKTLLETSDIATINSAIMNVDDNNKNGDETETGTLGNGDDSSNGEDNEDNGDGDELDDNTNIDFGQTKSISKQFLPAYKKPTVAVTFPRFLLISALTFPEKMMNLMNYATTRRIESDKKTFCVSWLPDGKSFVIYDSKNFTNDVIPKFFRATKFGSFVRKLYRWGFRQLNSRLGLHSKLGKESIIFGNEFFQQKKAHLNKMRHSNSNNNAATAALAVQVDSTNDTDSVFKKVIKNGTGPSFRNTVLQRPLLEMQHQLLAYSQQQEFEQRLRHQQQQQQQELRYQQQHYMQQQQQQQLRYQNLQKQQFVMFCAGIGMNGSNGNGNGNGNDR